MAVLWLWLSLWCWLSEAVVSPGSVPQCDLGPCHCTSSKLACDCSNSKIKDVVLKDVHEYGPTFSSINVSNCGRLHVTSEAVSGLAALQHVTVTNVTSVTLEERAFSWTAEDGGYSGLTVDISHCAVPEIPSYTFMGSLRAVLFHRVNVSLTRAFSFAAIRHAERLHFSGVRVAQFHPQTFKKLSVDYLIVTDSTFDTLPTRTMADVEVHNDLVFDGVSIKTIQHSGLKIHGPKHFYLTRSSIGSIAKAAFHIHTRGPASLTDNIFSHAEKGSFSGITVEKKFIEESGRQEITFENNTLTDFEEGVLILNTTGFNPKLERIVVNNSCSCLDVNLWSAGLVFFSSDSSVITPAPHVASVLFCVDGSLLSELQAFQRSHCTIRRTYVVTTLVVVTACILTLAVVGLLVYCGCKSRAERYMSVPNSPSPLRINKDPVLVVPDGKTYRETELHVIVEHVTPLPPSTIPQ